jgi:putative transposase
VLLAAQTAEKMRAVVSHPHRLSAESFDSARRSTVVETTMDVNEWLRKQLEAASPDLLRAMVQDFAEALMSAEADSLCGAPYGERSPERVDIRNGYRERAWGTRVGTIEPQIPRLRQGSYVPHRLL